MITAITTYMFRFNLPDGPHIATHRTVTRPKDDKDQEAIIKLRDEINKAIGQNPDATIEWDSLRAVKSHEEIVAAVNDLKAEDPDRPLAHELGIDATNRFLTNPEVAQTLAAANEMRKAGVGGGSSIGV